VAVHFDRARRSGEIQERRSALQSDAPRAASIGPIEIDAPELDKATRKLLKKAIKAEQKVLDALGLAALRGRVEKLGPEQVFRAIRSTEKLHAKAKVDGPKLLDLPVAETAMVPISWIRPGQVQISALNVRSKMHDFVERIDDRRRELKEGGPLEEARLLSTDEALKAVIGPGGKYLVLTDGHHHVAALKAVQNVIDKIIGDGFSHGGRLSTGKTGEELQLVRQLLGGHGGVPSIPVRIVADLSSFPEDAFWKTMSTSVEGRQLAYLDTRTGKKLATPPLGFASLEDNPYRSLASITTGKIDVREIDGQPKLTIRGADDPVWLKVINHAPDFIEFHIARVYEDAFAKAGLTYDPKKPVTEEMRAVCRASLFAVKLDPDHPLHAALKDLMILTKDRTKPELRKKIQLVEGELVIPRKLYRPSKRRVARIAARYEELSGKKRKV
jgi:hypothetical protein